MDKTDAIRFHDEDRVLSLLRSLSIVVVDTNRSHADVAEFLVQQIPLHFIAGLLESLQHLELAGIGENGDLIVIVVRVADQNQVGRHALLAIAFNGVRIKDDARAFARRQVEIGMPVPAEHRFFRIGGKRLAGQDKKNERSKSGKFHSYDLTLYQRNSSGLFPA